MPFDDSPLASSVAADLVLVVAPATGRFRPQVADGTVAPGDLLGVVTGGGGRADEVRSPVPAAVGALLARAGQVVTRGQALVWLQRTAEARA
jgi:biotin carboxyl carrier protein